MDAAPRRARSRHEMLSLCRTPPTGRAASAASRSCVSSTHPLTRSRRDAVSPPERNAQIDKIDEILSFDKGFFLTIRAIQLLKQHANGRPILVGIAGPSGAGKTVFCQKIQDFMPGLCVLSMDMYNDASMLLDGNFDDPRLTDYDLLNQNLRDLKAGKTIEAPIYDFKQSKRVGTRTVEVPSSNVIIIEGIYALNDKLRPLQDLRVSISGGVHFDLVKRVMRDITRSGQAPEDIIHQISETVYPMYKAYIEPDLRTAHLRVENSFNPFAGFQVGLCHLDAAALFFSSPDFSIDRSIVVADDWQLCVIFPICEDSRVSSNTETCLASEEKKNQEATNVVLSPLSPPWPLQPTARRR